MRSIILAAALSISIGNTLEPMTQAASQSQDVDRPASATLDSLRDRYRPLLVFAATDRDPRFLKQAQLFGRDASAMHGRQVLFVPLIKKKEDPEPAASSAADHAELSVEAAAATRRRFRIAADEFAVILIGKDGGEKFRTHTPVTIERLNAVIDAMPMRQQEVRNGNSK